MNGSRPIACIVEGHGDRESVPVLIERVAAGLNPPVQVHVPLVLRVQRSKLVKPEEVEKAVELAARKVGPRGPILILIDSDDDCPANLGPGLLARARAARNDRMISVVLATREFEAWFLAAATSLRGIRGLSADLEPPERPEGIRGAKEWLSRRKTDGTTYSEVIDQPELTSLFDFAQAMNALSFKRCHREIARLLRS